MVDEKMAVSHLQDIIRCKTISYPDRRRIDFSEFAKLREHLKINYPLLHQQAEVTLIEGNSLIYLLKGHNTTKLPLGLMGHMDVVPVSEKGWSCDAFSAEIRDGYVYGRGTLDMKGQVTAILEAVESCLKEQRSFDQDIYILLGHNEETGSSVADSGARKSMEYLKSKGILFGLIIDEGGAFISGKALGVEGNIALIGICEKGYMDVMLSVSQQGGHASMPPRKSALNLVCEAAIRIENHKFPSSFNPASAAMFDALVPSMKQPLKSLFAHRNVSGPLLLKALTRSPMSAALVRTTCVMTQAQGSKASNVLPQKASVVLNLRLAPCDSVDHVMKRLKSLAGSSVEVTQLMANEPTSLSPVSGPHYDRIRQAILHSFPDYKVVAPYPVVAATDSRVYSDMAEATYRFVPFPSLIEDLSTLHADNERIKIESFIQGIEFFKKILAPSK